MMDTWSSYVSTIDKTEKSLYKIIDLMSYFSATNTPRVIKEAKKETIVP